MQDDPLLHPPCKKKAKLWIQEIDEHAQNNLHSVEYDSTLRNNIERKLQQYHHVVAASDDNDDDLDLDHILSQVPYRSILENLFANCNDKAAVSSNTDLPALPIISKTYEESFMRQPHPHESPCVMGNMCECQKIDPCAPFIGVEFRMFNDPVGKPQMCVLCSRRATQKMYYDMVYSGVSPVCVIQRYGNIFNQPGEYAVQCMLSCPQGFNLKCMPLPIMSHARNKYSVVSLNGMKYLQQHRVSFEHFQSPSDTLPTTQTVVPEH
jgi:hypothetical protein